MKRILAHLLLCAAVAAALVPTAPAPSPSPADPAVPAPPQTLIPPDVPEWLPATGASTCDGVCDTGAAEVLLGVKCSTTSASQCCASLASQCVHFDGVCAGDAEILCQF